MKHNVLHRSIVFGIFVLFFGIAIISSTVGITIEKTISTNITFRGYIQGLIDNASDGDTIVIPSGTYYEHIIINKSITLIGEDQNTTIIDGGGIGTVVEIPVSSVTMSGITVTNGGEGMWDHGINIGEWNKSLSNIHLFDCIVSKNGGGIRFDGVSDSSVKDCVIHNNSMSCITIYLSSTNIDVNNCIMKDNALNERFVGGLCIDGIDYQCSYIKIANCTIQHNWAAGISISEANHIEISHNLIIENIMGVRVSGDAGPLSSIFVQNNTLTENGRKNRSFSTGILLQSCHNCVTIRDNNIVSNRVDGIYLLRASGNTIAENNIMGNARMNAFIMYSPFSFNDNTSLCNFWSENYWGRAHFLPKPIFGLARMKVGNFLPLWFPFANIDGHPAREPYDIPG
jgi:parallel beta-helix repeat protein